MNTAARYGLIAGIIILGASFAAVSSAAPRTVAPKTIAFRDGIKFWSVHYDVKTVPLAHLTKGFETAGSRGRLITARVSPLQNTSAHIGKYYNVEGRYLNFNASLWNGVSSDIIRGQVQINALSAKVLVNGDEFKLDKITRDGKTYYEHRQEASLPRQGPRRGYLLQLFPEEGKMLFTKQSFYSDLLYRDNRGAGYRDTGPIVDTVQVKFNPIDPSALKYEERY